MINKLLSKNLFTFFTLLFLLSAETAFAKQAKTPEQAFEIFFKAAKEKNAGKMVDTFSQNTIDFLLEDFEVKNRKALKKQIKERIKAALKESDEKDLDWSKASYEIIKKERAGKRCTLYINYSLQGSDLDKPDIDELDFSLVEEAGVWKMDLEELYDHLTHARHRPYHAR